MPSKTAEPDLVRAKLAFVWVQDARPVKWRTRIVRDRHSGRLAEVPLTELEPEDPGSEGVPYCFAAGEVVPVSHPAVDAKPACFVPYEQGPPR
jgi:hypothetical protein